MEGGMRRGRIQLELSGTNGLCLGITRHPCDKTHAVFCDNQALVAESAGVLLSAGALLKDVQRWVGDGGKATLVGAPDADMMCKMFSNSRKS